MGRKKVRNYPSREFYEEMLTKYFEEHRCEVIGYAMDRLGYTSFQKLQEDEYNSRFGFDCGWIHLCPKNAEMRHEWELDNGTYCAYVWCSPSYFPQSTTIQKVQVEKAVRDLELGDVFYIDVRLD